MILYFVYLVMSFGVMVLTLGILRGLESEFPTAMLIAIGVALTWPLFVALALVAGVCGLLYVLIMAPIWLVAAWRGKRTPEPIS